MLRKWGTIVLLLLATPMLASAQNTGRLAGVVLEAETQEPLPGANVFLEGTALGAATNADGEYNIFEVPPGVYTIRVSFVGFVTEVRSNVEVIAGITTRENFTLSPVTGEIEEIQVVAERPLVNPTSTSAVRRLSREEFANLPTRDVATFYAIQPGVTVLNDKVYIRGGRPDETDYLLEGLTSRSLVGGDNVMPVIPEALEEIQVFAGGYSAELGGANAGIVQQVLRTGGPRLSTSVQYETDEAASAFDAHSYAFDDLTVTAGGPFTNEHRFFLALNHQSADNYNPQFWFGSDLGVPVDDITGDTARAALAWEEGELPSMGRPEDLLRVNGTLSFNFHPLRVRLGYAQMNRDRRLNSLPILNMYNTERLPKREDTRRLGSVQANYFLTDNTYLEASGGFFQYDFEIFDPLFDQPSADGAGGAVLNLVDYYSREAVREALSDNPDLAELYTADWRGAYTPPADYVFTGFEFARPGQPSITPSTTAPYQRREQSYFNTALALRSQAGNHALAVGGHYQRWTLRQYVLVPRSLASRLQNDETYADSIAAATPAVAAEIRRSGYGGIGYDEFMNKIDSGPDAPKHPVTSSLYINDRIEFNDIIVNAGLRWDYFDMDLWTTEDKTSPQFDRANWSVGGLQPAGGTSVLQPRLGLSFPVTDRTVFHLQYGKFAQMPDMNFAYTRRSRMATIFSGQFFIRQPFAWDLDPIKTTQYEIGIGHQFTNEAAFDLTAFYRKTDGQLEIVQIGTDPASEAGDYNVFQNGDFAIARGFELSLRTRRVFNFMGMFNYTLTDAKGTNSEPSGQVSALENETAPPSLIQPLAFEERHRGSVMIDYRSGETGGPLLQHWSANVLVTFHSGHRFTRSVGGIGQRGAGEGALLTDEDPRGRIPVEPLGASQTPWFFNTDLRIEKGFSVGGLQATAYSYVQNIFDTKNIVNVYLRTGNADDDGFLSDPALSRQIVQARGDQFVQYYNAINLLNRQHYIDDTGLDLFAVPRQVRIGLRVEL